MVVRPIPRADSFLPLNADRMPPSSYRPSPPSVRPVSSHPIEPDRSAVDRSPPAREVTLRSAPEPPRDETEESADMRAKKKKKKRGPRSPESIAKFKATIAARKQARAAAEDRPKRVPKREAATRSVPAA